MPAPLPPSGFRWCYRDQTARSVVVGGKEFVVFWQLEWTPHCDLFLSLIVDYGRDGTGKTCADDDCHAYSDCETTVLPALHVRLVIHLAGAIWL